MFFIILGYLLNSAVATILPKPTHANETRWKSFKVVLLKMPFKSYSQLPTIHLKLLFLFFGLFLFFNLNFLSGTIRTEKLSVATEEIVDSTFKLVSTLKTIVISGLTSNLIKKSPKASFLKKLSKKNFLVDEGGSNILDRMKENGTPV